MGDQRSKEDDVRMISTSIYVTNFPDHINAKELWRVCSQYGNVIDSFIPNRRSKNGVNSWFSSIQQASDSFSIDERVAWIDVEGIPLKDWSRNTFIKIYSKWCSLLYEEGEDAPYFHRKRLCIKTTSNENIFESFKIVVKGKIFWIHVKEVSGWAPDFSDSQDDSSESHNEFVDDKSKDRYTEKASEAEEIPDTVFEAKEPGEIKGSVTKEYPKRPSRFSPHKSDGLVKKHVSSEQDHGSKTVTKEDETKMEHANLFDIISCWGNLHFAFVVGPSVGNSGGILCVWDSNVFHKENSTVLDYFIAIMGKWLPNDKNYLIISVYAPQELSEKKMVWQYLVHVIGGWNGDVIIMGDFNKVCIEAERFGSTFNARGAAAFNSFISTGGLVEVPSSGNCSNISSITFDRFLSDHRPILLHEICLDYGPIPFRFFHHWFDIIGFDSFMSEAWKEIKIQEYNAMLKLAKKLKILKENIRSWVKDKKEKVHVLKNSLKKKLVDIDSVLDKGEVTSDLLEDRLDTMNSLTKLEKMESLELAQKSKIKWLIEGDENPKYFHGIINKKRNNLAIKGIIVDGVWIEDPSVLKNEFLSHFRNRFDSPCTDRLTLDMEFHNVLSYEKAQDLERVFLKDEIKQAVWDCGLDKSPGPDGFTFGFYRKFWSLLEDDVVDAVCYFFNNGFCLKGINSSFIALIPKSQGANMVKDLRPINLIGSIYKIIAKLLANRLCKAKKKQSMIFKVDFEKAFDFVRWDFLDDILKNFSFGLRWRDWIQSCLKSSRGLILVNGSPTSEFQFSKGLKQGIRINLQKCGLMGIAIETNKVDTAANNLSCRILKYPFSYLGVNIGGHMTRINSWDVVINKILSRLSKWKMKVLSIEGRLTLLKSVLGATPIYYMSMFKAPIQVINKLESIRSHFFNGVDYNVRKMTFVNWKNVLASKEKGGLGVSSFYALNRALIFKWIWRFRTNLIRFGLGPLWLFTGRMGIDLHSFVIKKIGNGVHTHFWEETWKGDAAFKTLFPRIYALDLFKDISVAEKMAHPSISFSFRRDPRLGSELVQMASLQSHLEGIVLSNMLDRWIWSLSGDGEFSVSSVRNLIDDKTLGTVGSKTQWCKFVPIKVNILSWRVKLNNLPTRLNLSRRGMELHSIFCPLCNMAVESTNHLFFASPMMKNLYKVITRWWDVKVLEVSTYEEWWSWPNSLRLSFKIKMVLQGVFITWWLAWKFRNQIIFGPNNMSKGRLFDDIVALSISWCSSR
ncbi:RNA-directed DNA polymerase, eukaryota, partial [Tanacetum coccineum]